MAKQKKCYVCGKKIKGTKDGISASNYYCRKCWRALMNMADDLEKDKAK